MKGSLRESLKLLRSPRRASFSDDALAWNRDGELVWEPDWDEVLPYVRVRGAARFCW